MVGEIVRRKRTYVSISVVSFESPNSGSGERPVTIGSHEVTGRGKAVAARKFFSERWWSTLTPKLLLLFVLLPWEMKLFAPLATFACGKYAAMFNDTGSSRSTGIWLFGNGLLAVNLCFSASGLPNASVAFEKSPFRYSGRGTIPSCVFPSTTRSDSHENIKKVRFRPSYIFGSASGPVIVAPNWFRRSFDLSTSK